MFILPSKQICNSQHATATNSAGAITLVKIHNC